jgi:protein-disulfide isomerase
MPRNSLIAAFFMWIVAANLTPARAQGSPDGQAGPVTTRTLGTGDTIRFVLNGIGQSLGNPKAKVVLIEFATYECSYCVKFFRETFPSLKSQFIDTGKVRFILRDLPLDIFPFAYDTARAARCANLQSAFWKVSNYLYSQPFRKWRDKNQAIEEIAKATSIKSNEFRECVVSRRFYDDISKEVADSTKLGLTATPTFFLGSVDDGTLDGIVIAGAYPIEKYERAIKILLGER